MPWWGAHNGEMGSGESVELHISMQLDTAQLMVQVHLLLMGREVEF